MLRQPLALHWCNRQAKDYLEKTAHYHQRQSCQWTLHLEARSILSQPLTSNGRLVTAITKYNYPSALNLPKSECLQACCLQVAIQESEEVFLSVMHNCSAAGLKKRAIDIMDSKAVETIQGHGLPWCETGSNLSRKIFESEVESEFKSFSESIVILFRSSLLRKAIKVEKNGSKWRDMTMASELV